mmetsp:Transcript_12373/g.28147  ORF Transcript_12373/g.28147 Transcript_12373/m.28147 type:complete len:309 (-) Transcript_12373:672-1598(-)
MNIERGSRHGPGPKPCEHAQWPPDMSPIMVRNFWGAFFCRMFCCRPSFVFILFSWRMMATILLPSRAFSLWDIATWQTPFVSISGVLDASGPARLRPPKPAPGMASWLARVPRCFHMCATSRCTAMWPLGSLRSPLSMSVAGCSPSTRITSRNSSSSSHSRTSALPSLASLSSSSSSPSLSSSPSSSASSSVSSSSPSFSLAMPRRPVAPPAFTRRPPLLPASLRMRRSWSTTKCASRSARPPAYREPRASASRPSPGSAPAMLQAPAYWASDRAPPLAAAHSCPSSSKSRRPSLSASKNRSSEATFC